MNISIKNIPRYIKYFRIISHKPLVIIKIVSNYFDLIFLKKKVVRKVEIGVTFDCQCNCEKCSSKKMGNLQKKKLLLKEIKQIAKQVLSLGAVQVNFTGGEPLLERDLTKIIECFQPRKTIITINTNGLLLNEEKIDELEEAGVDIIKISIDSPIAEEHDESRGYKGCFEQAIKALTYIMGKRRIIGQISTVCVKENLNSFRIWELLAMAKRYNALLGLTIPAVSGSWSENEDILIGDEEKKVLNKLLRYPWVIRDTDESYLRTACPAGSEEFYLTCYGDIIPCPLIQISFGNTREEDVKTIWKKMSAFKEFKNKKGHGCLAGENRDFINKNLFPFKNYKNLPISIEELQEIQRRPHAFEKNS